jgi:hypothetical protein
MATDILEITNEVLALFKQYELSRVQTIFVIEAVKLSINEEIIRETIQDEKKGFDSLPGVL